MDKRMNTIIEWGCAVGAWVILILMFLTIACAHNEVRPLICDECITDYRKCAYCTTCSEKADKCCCIHEDNCPCERDPTKDIQFGIKVR